jgi:hypothetical protein
VSASSKSRRKASSASKATAKSRLAASFRKLIRPRLRDLVGTYRQCSGGFEASLA